MGKRYYHITIVLFCASLQVLAQTGGRTVFQFLNLSPGARLSALGGMPIAWRAGDPGTVFQNPSLLTDTMQGSIYFAHQFYFSEIGSGHFAYSSRLNKQGINLQVGIHYSSFGNIPHTDIYDNTLGEFKPKETDFYIAASRQIKDRLILGANVQYVFSNIDVYSAQGLCFNAGVSYFNPEKRFGLSLLIKNAGFQTKKYNEERENLPFEIQLGFAKRLKYLPLTYHITLQHLQNWDLRYDDPNLDSDAVLFGQTSDDSAFDKFVGNFFRHFVLGLELSLTKKENFVIRLGYNHLRSKDLSLSDYRSLAGISGGFGMKIYKFRFDYSYAVYHIAGGTSQITFSTNLNSFLKKEM